MCCRSTRWIAACLVAGVLLPREARAADDPPPAGQDRPELMVQIGHASYLKRIAVSPDGKRLLTAALDASPRLWDLETGKLLRVFTGHSASVMAVAFSPGGKRVLTGGFDNTVRLWD